MPRVGPGFRAHHPPETQSHCSGLGICQHRLSWFPRTGLLPPDQAQTKLSMDISSLALVLRLLIWLFR